MIRQDIKKEIQTALTGVPGIKAVFVSRQKITQNQQTPCITIYLPDVREVAGTSGVPMGKRKIEMTALLEIVMLDVNSTPEIGEAAFDDILDAIDSKIRANFTLGGISAGAAIKNLETHVAAPQLIEGQNVFRAAVKKFDVTVFITGIASEGTYTYLV